MARSRNKKKKGNKGKGKEAAPDAKHNILENIQARFKEYEGIDVENMGTFDSFEEFTEFAEFAASTRILDGMKEYGPRAQAAAIGDAPPAGPDRTVHRKPKVDVPLTQSAKVCHSKQFTKEWNDMLVMEYSAKVNSNYNAGVTYYFSKMREDYTNMRIKQVTDDLGERHAKFVRQLLDRLRREYNERAEAVKERVDWYNKVLFFLIECKMWEGKWECDTDEEAKAESQSCLDDASGKHDDALVRWMLMRAEQERQVAEMGGRATWHLFAGEDDPTYNAIISRPQQQVGYIETEDGLAPVIL